ncbi:MAG: hypothetical protein U0414_08835 [Polyangiaceae bacterium]
MRARRFGLVVVAVLVFLSDGASGGPLSSAPVASSSASPLRAADIPTERSALPSPEEWASAQIVTTPKLEQACEARRVRDWLRIACKDQLGAGVVAGAAKEARAWSHIESTAPELAFESGVDLHLTRGKSFIVSFVDTKRSFYSGASTSDGPTFQVTWRRADGEPTLTASLVRPTM